MCTNDDDTDFGSKKYSATCVIREGNRCMDVRVFVVCVCCFAGVRLCEYDFSQTNEKTNIERTNRRTTNRGTNI